MSDIETVTEAVTAPTPAPAKPKAAPVDHAALARELVAPGTGVDVSFSQDELLFLKKLIDNPEASYVELFGDAHGTRIEVDGVTIPNFQEALDDAAKFSLPTARAAVKKLKAITTAAEQVRLAGAKLRKQVVDNATRAVRKKAGGRDFLEMDGLTQRLRAVANLTNPLELENRASRRTDAEGSNLLAYVTGSAIAPCQSGDHERAVQDLMSRVADHTAALAAATGLKPELIRRRVAPVPGAFKPEQVAVSVQYALIVSSTKQFRLLIEALETLGELSALDPRLCGANLLAYNASFGLEGYDPVHDEASEGSDAATLDVAI